MKEKTNLDQNVNNCTFIKTILMFSVVLYHSCVFWTGGWFTVIEPIYNSRILYCVSKFLNSFHVYCFILVSGYLFFYLKNEKGKYVEYTDFIQKKVIRLLLPYCAICFLCVAPITAYFYRYKVQEIIRYYVLGESPSQLWFVLALFWIFVIVWPLSNLLKRSWFFSSVISGVLFVIGMIGAKYVPNLFSIFTGLQYFVFLY